MQILGEAIEREPESRDGWVDTVCAGDEALRAEVARLLARQKPAAQFLEESPLAAAAESNVRSMIGERVGLYKIISEIGRGGMGAVYLAERDDQEFVKRVAIKLIKRGMDTDFVVQRFRNERQILANLDHPNIARLLDGGTTATDLPYFIMEYVEGEPIITHANANQLTTTERLKLFRTVCSAVQYAHQNLVIHRDLKPSNILVTKEGEPKLLDFGIAKLLQADGEPETELTATAVRVMTPEYASPEQIKGERITTSSDVYSLGVLLYELLTGQRPYRVKSRQPEEIAKAICEQEPERPSAAVRMTAFRVPTSVGSSGRDKSPTEVGTLNTRNLKLLRGDLDNIVLKALRKEPQRRYASADQFSEDIRRHLEGLPVTARKDTFSYRTSKFIQRNKIGVAAAAIILLVLLGGITATTWQARVARAQRARAERRFNDVRKLADIYMFEFYDSIKDLPGSLAARQLVIKRALEYLDSLAREVGDDRTLQAELALAYQKVGSITFDVEQMVESRHRALLINEALMKADPGNDVYRKQLSDGYDQMGDAMKIAGNTTRALEYARQSLEVINTLPLEHAASDYRALVADRYLSLGLAQAESGDVTHAIESDCQAVEIQKTIVTNEPANKEVLRDLSGMYGHLSYALEENGDYAKALEYTRKDMNIARAMLESDPSNVRYRRDIWASYLRDGRLRAETGDLSGARQSLRWSLEYIQKLSAADPQDKGHRLWLAVTHLTLGNVLANSNKVNEALKTYSKALAIAEPLVAVDSKWWEARRYLTNMYTSTGRLQGHTELAIDYFRKAIRLAEESCSADPQNARMRRGLAETYSGMATVYSSMPAKSAPSKNIKSLGEARSWYQKSLDIYQDMKNKGTLNGAVASKPDEVARDIAKCDDALKKLGSR